MSANASYSHGSIDVPCLPTYAGLQSIQSYQMQKSEIINEEIQFKNPDGFNKALKDGFFLVKIPKGFDVASGDKFCNNFYSDKNGGIDDEYKGFKDIPKHDKRGVLKGYTNRPNNQVEDFGIGREKWNEILPTGVANLAYKMNDLAINILKSVLKKLEIDQKDWRKVTGGLIENKGNQLMNFNHFKSNKHGIGLKFHRDFGFVTILRSLEQGLVALIDNTMFTINPEEDYFIVNFGRQLELLTQYQETPVRASIHGVTRIEKKPGEDDRISYTFFSEANVDEHIYIYTGKLQSCEAFLKQESKILYKDPSTETL